MNDRNDPFSSSDTDSGPRDAYRQIATEVPPAILDELVLQMSRRAARERKFSASIPAWFGPATFAAVAGLCITLILLFGGIGQIPNRDDPSGWTDNSERNDDQGSIRGLTEAVESTGKQLRALDSATGSLISNNQTAPATSPPGRSQSTEQTGVRSSSNCDPELRSSVESWWSCIKMLEQDGFPDAARREVELMERAYPEFEATR